MDRLHHLTNYSVGPNMFPLSKGLHSRTSKILSQVLISNYVSLLFYRVTCLVGCNNYSYLYISYKEKSGKGSKVRMHNRVL